MAGSPIKRQRREVHEAGEAQRAETAKKPRTRAFDADKAAAVREAAAAATPSAATVSARAGRNKTKEEIRDAALTKFWPMAEKVVADALAGKEVNREQLSAAFKVLEQQLGRPGQQSGDVDKDTPTVIVYEAAAFDPTQWLKPPKPS
jgi:hypothetical protein